MLRAQGRESGRERGVRTKEVGTISRYIFEFCENVYFVPKSRLKHSLSSRKKEKRKKKQQKTNHSSQWQMKVINARCLPSPINRFWVLRRSLLGARCRVNTWAARTRHHEQACHFTCRAALDQILLRVSRVGKGCHFRGLMSTSGKQMFTGTNLRSSELQKSLGQKWKPTLSHWPESIPDRSLVFPSPVGMCVQQSTVTPPEILCI